MVLLSITATLVVLQNYAQPFRKHRAWSVSINCTLQYDDPCCRPIVRSRGQGKQRARDLGPSIPAFPLGRTNYMSTSSSPFPSPTSPLSSHSTGRTRPPPLGEARPLAQAPPLDEALPLTEAPPTAEAQPPCEFFLAPRQTPQLRRSMTLISNKPFSTVVVCCDPKM